MRVPKGKHTLSTGMLGYEPFEMQLEVSAKISGLEIKLKESKLSIDSVTVVAKQTQSKSGTSTFVVGQEAIKQIQAISLGDIMQLLPGSKMQQQSLSGPTQVNLRSTGDDAGINAFGTSVVVDGIPISNDSNMQGVANSSTSSTPSNVMNRGVDMREISANSIESVEVVTGVASAKYGNITSGTVLVTRKAGQTPLFITANLTPSTYQGSLSRGFRLPKKLGYLNVDADYTYSESSPVNRADYYERISGGVRWSTTISEKLGWNNTLSLNYSSQGNRERYDENKVEERTTETSNNRLSVSLNGRLKVLGSLNYSAGYSYAEQNSRYESMEAGPIPLLESLEEGTFQVPYSETKFPQLLTINGGPRNFYSRVEANQNLTAGEFVFGFSTGAEYTYDVNRGEGYALAGGAVKPSTSGGSPGSRSADYRELPASTMFAAYEEVDIRYTGENSTYVMRLGGRYDYMNSRYHLLSPRLSLSAQYFEKLRLRAAWGLSYKAPSMASLYPTPIYTDVTNLSHYNPSVPDQSYAVVTTYIHEPENDHLQPSRGETLELGVDYEPGDWSFRLTGYIKEITNGIGSYDFLMPYERVIYAPDPNDPTTAIPTQESDVVLISLDRYDNTTTSKTTGLELIVEPPRIEATKTSFMISGSVMESNTSSPLLDLRQRANEASIYGNRYGLYEPTTMNSLTSRANVTVIQHIPRLGLLATFVSELNFVDRRQTIGSSLYPVGFYNKDGVYTDLTGADFTTAEYSGLVLDEVNYEPTTIPFYANFHLQLRKETRQGHSFSFFANNCFWYNPTYNVTNSTAISTHNSRVTFGFGVTFKIQ